jgi:hypothetical protein
LLLAGMAHQWFRSFYILPVICRQREALLAAVGADLPIGIGLRFGAWASGIAIDLVV